MHNLLIIYAPDTPENRRGADEVRSSFDASRFKFSVKSAAVASMPDIAAADLVLFGLGRAGGTGDIPEDFSELARAFRGVNLAGKTAGIFSFGKDTASARLRQILEDSEISMADVELVLDDLHASDTRGWAQAMTALFQGVQDARR